MAVRAPVALTVLVVGDDISRVDAALDATGEKRLETKLLTAPDTAAARSSLEADRIDCIVASTPADRERTAAVLEELATVEPDVPVVWIAGDGDEATAAIEAGATDHLLSSVADARPGLLADRILRAVETVPENAFPGSRGWYDALLEHSMDALTVLDADGTFVYQSPSIQRLLGYQPEELVGTNSLEYVHPDDYDEVYAQFERLFERGTDASMDLEYRFRSADGSWKWIESLVTARPEPGIGGYVVNSRLITERKEREQEVERYETLLSVMPDTIAITDLEGYHVDIYGFEGWSGYDPEELLGEHISKTTPQEDLERAEQVVTDLLAGGDTEKATFETRVETKDGEIVPIENHVTPLPPDDEGNVPGTMNVLRNIEDRKEREQRLEQSETVFQNARDGIALLWVTDDGRFVYQRANEAFEAMTGLPEGEIREKTPADVIPDPDIAAETEGLLAEVVETRSPLHQEYHLPDIPQLPTYLDAWIAPVIVDDQVDSLVVIIRDITERKERQRELELKNRAMDAAPIGISIAEVTDTGPSLTYVNEGFEQLTGYEGDDVFGESWSVLHGDETDAATVDTLQTAYANEEAASVEVQIYRADGVPRWCQASLAPVCDDGEVTHYVGFQQDITDRKEYETEIERRFDEFADVFTEDLQHPLEEALVAIDDARGNGTGDSLDDAAEWIQRADSLLEDLATVHSFSVPSRDLSESALREPADEA